MTGCEISYALSLLMVAITDLNEVERRHEKFEANSCLAIRKINSHSCIHVLDRIRSFFVCRKNIYPSRELVSYDDTLSRATLVPYTCINIHTYRRSTPSTGSSIKSPAMEELPTRVTRSSKERYDVRSRRMLKISSDLLMHPTAL